MNVYRIFPVLWKDTTVYGVDRAGAFPTACGSRVKEDPAYFWSSSTFLRLLPPPDSGSGCCGYNDRVVWETLPAWLSFVQSKGYTLNVDFSRLKPYSDVYISGP
jgi:hypothetical protein